MGDSQNLKILVSIEDENLRSKVLNNLNNDSFAITDKESFYFFDKIDLVIADFLPDKDKFGDNVFVIFSNELKNEDLLKIYSGSTLLSPNSSDNDITERINLMISYAKVVRNMKVQKEALMEGLWQMVNISPFYFVVTNRNNDIVLANVAFTNELNHNKDPKFDITKLNMFDIITKHDHYIANVAFDSLKFGYIKHLEAMYDIDSIDNTHKTIRWFMTYINSGMNLVLNVGIPTSVVSEEKCDEVECIRQYYANTVLKDRQLINAIKTQILERKINV